VVERRSATTNSRASPWVFFSILRTPRPPAQRKPVASAITHTALEHSLPQVWRERRQTLPAAMAVRLTPPLPTPAVWMGQRLRQAFGVPNALLLPARRVTYVKSTAPRVVATPVRQPARRAAQCP